MKVKRNQKYRRLYELLLDRREHPMFQLSWSLFHVIDETSPLYRLTLAELAAADELLMLNVSGVDDNSAQDLAARPLLAALGLSTNWTPAVVDR
jgi:inward rectifier potassium channel